MTSLFGQSVLRPNFSSAHWLSESLSQEVESRTDTMYDP